MLRWVGLVFSVVAIIFIGARFRDYGDQLAALNLSVSAIVALLLMVVAYAGLSRRPGASC